MAVLVTEVGEPDVLIATPTHNGDVAAPYAQALLHTVALLANNGYSCQPFFLMGNAIISFARALCVHRFMQIPKCQHLLFIDSDLWWDAEAALALIKSPHEFVAGVYPGKTPDHSPCFMTRSLRETPTQNYVETDGVPGGFMRLKRSAIEKMRKGYPELKITYKMGSFYQEDVYMLFENIIGNNEAIGEDYAFCQRWRALGEKIFIYPGIDFCHYGRGEWRGNMLENDKRLNPI